MAFAKSKLKKGDQIQIMTGKNRGKRGRILKISLLKETVLVERLNLVKKAVRKQEKGGTAQGGIIEIEAPIHISNVRLVCKKCGSAVRVGTRSSSDKGGRQRICKKCGEAV